MHFGTVSLPRRGRHMKLCNGYLIGYLFRNFGKTAFPGVLFSRCQKAKEAFKIKVKSRLINELINNKFQLLFHGTHRDFETYTVFTVYTSWWKATSAPVIYTLCSMKYCVFSLIASGSY